MNQLTAFRLFYTLFFFSASMFFSQTSVFLESKQLSGSEIGVILASISFAAMISQPIIGILADRFKNRRLILQLLFFTSAALILFLPTTTGFLPLLVLIFVFALFIEPTFTLADTTIIEAAKYNDQVEYGKVRWFGSIAWGIGSLTLGIILQFFGGFSTAFTLFAILMASAGFLAFRFPNHQAKSAAKVEWHELRNLVKNRYFLFICLFSIFVGGVSLTANAYLALHLMDLGAAASLVGFAMFLPTLLEIISFNFSGKIINHLGLKRTFLLVCVTMICAQTIFLLAPHYTIVMLGMFLQGLIFPISISAIYQFLAQHFEAHILTTVSTFRATLAAGLSAFVFTLLAGFIYEAISLSAIFLMTASLMIIAFIITVGFFPKSPKHHS